MEPQCPSTPGAITAPMRGKEPGKSVWMSESPSLPGLKLSKSLSLVAQSHANDMSAHNFMDHIGSDGADLSERIDRFC